MVVIYWSVLTLCFIDNWWTLFKVYWYCTWWTSFTWICVYTFNGICVSVVSKTQVNVDYELYSLWNDVAKIKSSNNHLRQQKLSQTSKPNIKFQAIWNRKFIWVCKLALVKYYCIILDIYKKKVTFVKAMLFLVTGNNLLLLPTTVGLAAVYFVYTPMCQLLLCQQQGIFSDAFA